MKKSPGRTHILHDERAVEAYKILRGHVTAENRKLGIEQSNKPIAVFQWDNARGMMAGACGVVYPGWFSLELLWVEEPYRRQGIGAALLKRIENEAVRLGVHSAYVWTQEFEAPEFYRKYHYQQFVQLNEFLPGHQLIGMQKKLVNDAGQ